MDRQTDRQTITVKLIYSLFVFPQLSKLSQYTTQQVNKYEIVRKLNKDDILAGLVNKVIHFALLLSLPVQSLVMSGWWEEPVTVTVDWR